MKAKATMHALGAEARGASALGAGAFGSGALGAMAIGAAAFGAVAVGAVAIRTLAVGRGKFGRLTIEDLAVGRLRVRGLVVEDRREPHPFDALEKHRYVSLTTYRRSGEAVSTPMWFVIHGGRAYMTTDPDSGKMRRLRNDPRVRLTPCNVRGWTRGEGVECLGRPLEEGEAPESAAQAFHRKYRLGLGLLHLFGQREVGKLTLEISSIGDEDTT